MSVHPGSSPGVASTYPASLAREAVSGSRHFATRVGWKVAENLAEARISRLCKFMLFCSVELSRRFEVLEAPEIGSPLPGRRAAAVITLSPARP